MDLTTDRTLAEVVNASAGSARVLESFGLDCRTLADGCASYRAFSDGLAELETDTHLHVYKENNVRFPAVVALEQRWSNPVR